MSYELELFDLLESLDLATDDEFDTPTAIIEIDNIQWGDPDPDVGIPEPYADDWEESYFLEDVEYADLDSLVNAIIDLGYYAITADLLRKQIHEAIRDFVNEQDND